MTSSSGSCSPSPSTTSTTVRRSSGRARSGNKWTGARWRAAPPSHRSRGPSSPCSTSSRSFPKACLRRERADAVPGGTTARRARARPPRGSTRPAGAHRGRRSVPHRSGQHGTASRSGGGRGAPRGPRVASAQPARRAPSRRAERTRGDPVIRVAAVGDVHMATDAAGSLRDAFATLPDAADVLLLAGDLTRIGLEDEGQALLTELDGVDLPQLAVLGNHDYESDHAEALVKLLEHAGVRVLEGDTEVVQVGGSTLGIAGT